mgnify:CR=1 FL=1
MLGSSKTYGSYLGLCLKNSYVIRKYVESCAGCLIAFVFSCHIVFALAPSVSITSPRGGRVEVIEGQDLRLECELAPGDRSSQIYWTLRYESTYIKNSFPCKKLRKLWTCILYICIASQCFSS